MSITSVPFFRPSIGEEEIAAVTECLRSGWLTTGPKTAAFESAFAAYLGGGVEAIAVNSATAALHLGLEALGVGPGDTLMLQWEVPEAEIVAAARWGRTRGLRVMLNRAPAGPVPDELMAVLDLLVVNEHEVLALGAAGEDPSRVADRLSERHRIAVAVTLGAEGGELWADGICHEAPAFPVEAVDTTAAGDTFCGALNGAKLADTQFGIEARGVQQGAV